MAKAVLLGDLDTAFGAAREVCSAGRAQSMVSWPVMAALRDDPRYESLDLAVAVGPPTG